ncbi:kynureninase [Litchfieldella rifensis]|uniref:Kynureninase n=1 Tax=Litchfieldella rifensis TaxID=762643 RepID=A0ABV7LUM7_9GAMM
MSDTPLSREALARMDREDPLAHYRDQFELEEGLIYLDGNSLGALPKAAKARAAELMEREWGQGLIRSWNTHDWISLPERVGDKIASLIGAAPGEVVVADSTSVNLFKLAAAAVRMRPGRRKIVSEPGNFPTDLYILQGLEAFLPGEIQLETAPRERLETLIDDDTALVVLTHVHYKSGELFDMAAITARAHEVGALMLWDLSHSAGALPVDLNGVEADFAVGCGYKYLNGGPGAPGYLFVAQRHQAEFHQPLSGWFGHAEPFAMRDEYQPAPSIKRGLCGTTGVLATGVLEVGVELMASADMALVRAKSQRLGELFISLVERHCAGQGFALASPRDATKRGSQVSLTHEQGFAIVQALIARNIIGDFRAPNILRFGFAPLYTRYVDIWDMVQALADIMAQGEWDQPRFKKVTAVT